MRNYPRGILTVDLATKIPADVKFYAQLPFLCKSLDMEVFTWVSLTVILYIGVINTYFYNTKCHLDIRGGRELQTCMYEAIRKCHGEAVLGMWLLGFYVCTQKLLLDFKEKEKKIVSRLKCQIPFQVTLKVKGIKTIYETNWLDSVLKILTSFSTCLPFLTSRWR